VQLASCGSTFKSTGGAPIVICNQTLWTGAMMPVVYQVPLSVRHPQLPTLVAGTNAYPLIIQVAGCDRGADVSITPPGVLRVAAEVRANDARAAALRLRAGARAGTATVTVRRDGRVTGAITVVVVPSSAPPRG
jgi:hypothetical protein